MTFDLQEAGPADIDEIGNLLPICYINDPILSQVMPTTPVKKRGPFWAGWIRDEYSKGADKLFKVTDSGTGKIVAFTKVCYPAPASKDQHLDEEIPFPEGTNVELMGHWFEIMDTYKEKHKVPEKDYFFHVIGTHPDYHRKGLGSKLLERFLQDADRDNARVYLQATEIGAKMYPRYGFKDIEELTVNTPKGPVNWRCMMREAQPTKA